MISVLPQAQTGEYCVPTIDQAVPVAAVYRLVVLSQRKKAVLLSSCGCWRLRTDIAKKFTTIIDHPITITVKDKPSIGRIGGRPGELDLRAGTVKIKPNTVTRVGQLKSCSVHIN